MDVTTEPSSKQSEQLREILVEVAQTQLAAVSAAVRFWAGWAEAADKYTRSISEELARVDAEATDTGDLVGRLSDLTREYLRNMTELPRLAANHFDGELEKIGKPKRKRTRVARVKD